MRNISLLILAELKHYHDKQSYQQRLTFILIIALFNLLLCLVPLVVKANDYTNDQIANAIFKAENSVKYPYGIKSINTYGNVIYARKICLNTIRNNRKRFAKQTKYKDFLEFLGSRYCPPSAHSLNKNWVRNVRHFLNRTGV